MSSPSSSLKFLSASESQAIDEELFSSGGFSVDQLMELAGLSVAQAVWEEYGSGKCGSGEGGASTTVLVLCGPGNNGGDGLVAARHLTHFGMQCAVHYPKPTKRDLFDRLVLQLNNLHVPFVPDLPASLEQYDVIVDALFGFSFKGAPRPPFDHILNLLRDTKTSPIVSVDIPSGWNVDTGPGSDSFYPSTLISLTAPKLGARNFSGTHYLGGRFVPLDLAAKYGLHFEGLYKSSNQIVKLS